MKRWLCLILFASFSLSIPKIYKRWTHAFRPAKCLIQWPFMPEWEAGCLSADQKEQVHQIISKPFSYFSKGKQSYVFLSNDKKYVLKLFRFDSCQIPTMKQIVTRFQGKKKQILPLNQEIVKSFSSCKLAYDLAKDQTALVFVHLNPKKGLPILTVKDRLGFSHQIDPCLYRFTLQKRADPLLKIFRSHKNEVQPYLQAYLNLLEQIRELGLVNLDRTLWGNLGFLEGRAIYLDLGNFIYCPERASFEAAYFKELLRIWLEKKMPEAVCYLETSS